MINNEILDEVLEAVLFVSGSGLSLDDLKQHPEVSQKDLNEAIKRLEKKYGGKCGIKLIRYNNKIQFASNPDYSDIISCVLNPIKEKELSNAAMETMAIIAYRQPVTRLEIEQIRGVNCEYTVQMLLKHNLIEVVGRKDGVGKPLLFGTTENFLKRFQIASLDQLPDYEQLLQSIKIIERGDVNGQTNSGESESLYNEFEIKETEEEVPDFLEGEKIQKIVGNKEDPQTAK